MESFFTPAPSVVSAALTLIKTASAASIASVTQVTIRNWVNQYNIGHKIGGRYRVYLESLTFVVAGDMRGLNDFCKRNGID